MSRKTLPTPAGPTEIGSRNGLAYSLWLPAKAPEGGLVVLHGAGSCKENHHDMARAARDAGLAAVAFDMRGHGASEGALDGRVLDDVATIAELLPRPIALRGSSMGGWVAIAAAEIAGAAAVVAICPAPGELLLAGLRHDAFDFRADSEPLAQAIAEHDLGTIVERSQIPLMLLHAEGDERVPVEGSRDLHARSAAAVKRLIVLPGGHHRSVQHDVELQGEALRFIHRAFASSVPRGPYDP
jgi:uncharacterized protein